MGGQRENEVLVRKLPVLILFLSALVLVTLVVFWNNESQKVRLGPSGDLLIHYPLDSIDANGQTPDLVSGSNANTQGATLAEGVTSGALSIRSGTIDTGLDVDLAGDFTLNLWVKPTTVNGRQKLVSKEFFGVMNSSYSLFLHDGFLRFEFFNTSQSTGYVSVASDITIPADQWSMITVTLGKDLSIYIDSKSEGQVKDVTSRPFNRDISLLIGSTRNGSSLSSPTYIDNFDGSIDDVKIYNRALSESEIVASFQQGQSNLIRAYYDFNTLSANQISDASSYGLSGMVNGNPIAIRGIKGTNALALDGQGDYVQVNHAVPLNLQAGTFTLAAWVKTSAKGFTQIILEKNDAGTVTNFKNFGLYLNSTGSFHFFAKCNAAQDLGTTQSLNDGNWHSLVAVRDASVNKKYLYVDGERVLTTDDTDPSCDDFSSQAPLYIGARFAGNPSNNFFFNGSLDNVAIYTRVLTPAEIRTVYQEYFTYSPLRMSLGFNGMTNNQVTDDSDYNLNTLVVGNPSLVNGKEGSNALALDGNDYVVVDSNQILNLTKSYTLTSIIKTTASTTQMILEKNNAGTATSQDLKNFGLYLNSTGSFHFFAKCNAAQDLGTTQSLNDGNWHSLVAVRDDQANKRYLYIDGALALSADDTDPSCDDFSSQAPLYIGARFAGNPSNNFFFNGIIDRTEIYSRALTPTEVTDEYQDVFGTSSSGGSPRGGSGRGGSSGSGGSISVTPIVTNPNTDTTPIEPTIYQPTTDAESFPDVSSNQNSSSSTWFYIIIGVLGIVILASLIGLGMLVLKPRKAASSSRPSSSAVPISSSMPRPPFPPAMPIRPGMPMQPRPPASSPQSSRPPQQTLSIQPNPAQKPR